MSAPPMAMVRVTPITPDRAAVVPNRPRPKKVSLKLAL
jgi:hypothetical protein